MVSPNTSLLFSKPFIGASPLRGLALLALILAYGCSDKTPEDPILPEEPVDGAGVGGQPPVETLTLCQEAYPEACGQACSVDAPCPTGLFCSAGVCDAECAKDTDCSGGLCTELGKCEPISNIKVDPIETDPDPVEKDGPKCVEGEVEFESVMPQVWLLLDRSGSMTADLGGVSRWDGLGTVLLGDPTDSEDRGIVGDFQDRVAFGATFYTSGSGPTGCALDLESVALATNSYGAIQKRYNKIFPSGGTPTADAVAAVVASAAASDLTGGPKILVLATDGEPGGCSPRTEAATVEVEKEVTVGFSKGIRTFAVSIASDTNPVHMQRVANLGVGLAADADPPAPYFTAESQLELEAAFSSILEDVPRSCVFELNGEVDAENADQGTVTLAGVELTYDTPDGWVLSQADQVELVGAACEQIQAGEEDLDINFPCSVFTPVVK